MIIVCVSETLGLCPCLGTGASRALHSFLALRRDSTFLCVVCCSLRPNTEISAFVDDTEIELYCFVPTK